MWLVKYAVASSSPTRGPKILKAKWADNLVSGRRNSCIPWTAYWLGDSASFWRLADSLEWDRERSFAGHGEQHSHPRPELSHSLFGADNRVNNLRSEYPDRGNFRTTLRARTRERLGGGRWSYAQARAKCMLRLLEGIMLCQTAKKKTPRMRTKSVAAGLALMPGSRLSVESGLPFQDSRD